MINIAVLGYGTVGSGVVKVIDINGEVIARNTGQEVNVKYILDLRDFPGDPFEYKIVRDFETVINDPEIKVMCEVIGGVGKAYEFTRRALEKGISVCTSNKELVAKHGAELLALARENNCSYLFEASVGGGIPIIRPIMEALTAERIESVSGILNGTTNYILTKMEREGADFAEVLKEAQAKGYAENNPAADIEGYDPCRKIAILSSLMMGKNVDSEKIYTEGITKVTAADFAYAKEAGYTIKLLGQSKAQGDEVLAMVAPFMISKDHPLAMVNDVFNGIFVTGNTVGDTMYYGRGAGKLPTASAVVADVIECAKNVGQTIPCFWDQEQVALADISQVEWKYFLRAKASAKADVEAAFPGGRVIAVEGCEDEFGYITEAIVEKDFAEKYEALSDSILSRIRLA
ncbi:MAG: homoserine dehydrogenase [Lachnospiraceae bacterium]|nr:homoserine dehydrogenase [Lachnospiraceae bacterium]